ncbi:MAG: hypothetical protein R3E89_08915 [Thiolinea sp.]
MLTGGLGHRFSKQLSGQALLRWDRGTSTGYNPYTDSWMLGAGVEYALHPDLTLTLGGAMTFLSAGSNTTAEPVVRYQFGDDSFFTLAAGLRYQF